MAYDPVANLQLMRLMQHDPVSLMAGALAREVDDPTVNTFMEVVKDMVQQFAVEGLANPSVRAANFREHIQESLARGKADYLARMAAAQKLADEAAAVARGGH